MLASGDRSATSGEKAAGARSWRWTAGTGVALLGLVTVHMVAHHFVVNEVGGLRTYGQVLAYIGNPVILVLESLLLVTVTAHAMLGLRSVLLDLNLAPPTRRLVDRGLVALGIMTVVYGFVLIGVLASRA
jgi:succinate dehydrogenase / fumarate reductase membrane anchor subunit